MSNETVHYYSPDFERSLETGDIVEFMRSHWFGVPMPGKLYSHYRVYYKNGLIAHFNPANENQKINIANGCVSITVLFHLCS